MAVNNVASNWTRLKISAYLIVRESAQHGTHHTSSCPLNITLDIGDSETGFIAVCYTEEK
jgi:hypothetical protein